MKALEKMRKTMAQSPQVRRKKDDQPTKDIEEGDGTAPEKVTHTELTTQANK